MPANRLGLAFLLLIAAFLVLTGVAVVGLWAVGQSFLAGVVTAAGAAGVLAGAITYRFAKRTEDEVVASRPAAPKRPPQDPLQRPPQEAVQAAPKRPSQVAASPRPRMQRPLPRMPVKVQAMPVAELPPAYLAAVMKGTRAGTDALRAQERQR